MRTCAGPRCPGRPLEALPALERPADALEMGEITNDPLGRRADAKHDVEGDEFNGDDKHDGR
ncbi:hypothetical protein GCM10011428_85400 [Streptomyces violaceus]